MTRPTPAPRPSRDGCPGRGHRRHPHLPYRWRQSSTLAAPCQPAWRRAEARAARWRTPGAHPCCPRRLTSGPMPEKRYLVTPGPTPVPPEVLAATALPMIRRRFADSARPSSACSAAGEVYRTRSDVDLHLGRDGSDEVHRGQPARGDRVPLRFPRYFDSAGPDHAGLRPRCRPHAVEVGERDPDKIGARWLEELERRQGRLSGRLGRVDQGRRGRTRHRRLGRKFGALVAVDAVSSLAAVRLETEHRPRRRTW